MVRLALLAALAVASGCFEDRYKCSADADCDTGTAGRCETTGYCTSYDLTCDTHYRYTSHSELETNVCYDDSVVLANACAGGQAPAKPLGCFANVCSRLPACCEIGWLDACVPIAQEECDLTCDTRIAITAKTANTTELWDARWSGASWMVTKNTTLTAPLSWVAPAPGTTEPRLAGVQGAFLVIGETMLPRAPDHDYQSIASVSFDRHDLDTVAAGYTTVTGGNGVEIWRVDDQVSRTFTLNGSHLAWGDVNRDPFPDAVANSGGTNAYSFLENIEDEPNMRSLRNQTSGNLTGGPTTGVPGLRSIDWLDFDQDGNLDLAVFGMAVRLHMTAEGIRDVPDYDLDCSPPNLAKSCMADPEPDLEGVAFVGAGYPTRTQPAILFAQFPDRKVWRARLVNGTFTVDNVPFPNECRCIATCAGGDCTYDCSSCAPVFAITTRDLDGDHELDIVAIDAKLRIYTALTTKGLVWSAPTQIPTTATGAMNSVAISVTGVPL